jgi:hypothetical protein
MNFFTRSQHKLQFFISVRTAILVGSVNMDQDPVKYLGHCAGIFQVFGHHYFPIRSLSYTNQHEFPSWSYTAYFGIVFVTLTTLMVMVATFAASDEVGETLSAKTVLNQAVQHSMYIGLILIICVSLIQSFVSTPLTKKFYLNCLKIARMCKNDFHHTVNYLRLRNNAFRYLLLTTLLLLVTQSAVYFFDKIFFREKFWPTCIAVSPLLFLNATAFKFIFFVKLVNFHLEIVDDLIQEIFNRPLFERLKLHVTLVQPKTTSVMELKVRNLRRIFNIVRENSEIVNRSMGVTVLIITAVMVIVITASGYRMFLTIVGRLPVEKAGGKIYNKYY